MSQGKVLQIIESFNQGGSELQAIQLTAALKREGSFEIFLACLNRVGSLRQEAERIGFTQIPEYKLTGFLSIDFIRQVRRCTAFIKEQAIDIVQTHDFYTNVFGMSAARMAGAKVKIASKRETGSMRSGIQKRLERQAFRLSDAIIANSEAVKRYLAGEGVDKKKIYTIHNGVAFERFAVDVDLPGTALHAALGLPTDRRFVTLVANLRHPVKNQSMFLRSAKRVNSKIKNVGFILAGEGERMAGLKAEAEELGILADCFFVGRCDRIAELLAISEVGVLSSSNEGFSNSLLEYSAAELPVVATDVGGAREAIIENETGFLVDVDDDGLMAEKLVWLLEHRTEARKMGKNGRRNVEEKFTAKAQLQNTLKLYRTLLTQ